MTQASKVLKETIDRVSSKSSSLDDEAAQALEDAQEREEEIDYVLETSSDDDIFDKFFTVFGREPGTRS